MTYIKTTTSKGMRPVFRGRRSRRVTTVAVATALAVLVFAAAAFGWCRTYGASNASNFNGTSIAQGNGIWFNSVASFNNPFDGQVIQFWNQDITLSNHGKDYTIPLPASQVTFDSSAPSQGSAQFYPLGNKPGGVPGIYWYITVPPTSKNVFIGGDMIRLGTWKFPTSNGLPGGSNPVTWNIGEIASGDIHDNASSFSAQWKWGAAVYRNPPLNSSYINVLATDNSLHAGTPLNIKNYVVGGARGGGGSNFTGSYSGTKRIECIEPCRNN